MRERPILFSAPMVRAILAGTKTQTRRVVKPGNLGPSGLPERQPTPNWNAQHYGPGMWADGLNFASWCPYGAPGDRLWVRETFQPLFAEGFDHHTTDWETGKGYAVRYVATEGRTEWIDGDDNITDRRKPGIHMPRWASRITLEITGVRVERLQDISEADAMAEGIRERGDGFREVGDFVSMDAIGLYRALWESINGLGSWDLNPWVWVVEFRRVERGASHG